MESDGERLFSQYLKANDLTLTDERRDVVAAVYALHDHFSAEQLCNFLAKQRKNVSRASVYRTLSLLNDAGLVRTVDLGRSAVLYEPVHGKEHHDHMVCVVCGAITEFWDGELESIKDRVCSEARFVPERHAFKIFGYCCTCSEGGTGEEAL